MHRALGRWIDHGVILHQLVAQFRRTPSRVVTLELQDRALDLERELIGMPIRSTRAVFKAFKTAVLVAIEDLVPRDTRNAEFTTERRLLFFAFKGAGHKLQTFIHRFTHLPRRRDTPKYQVVK